MRTRLLWKLLLTNIIPVIAVIFLIVWLAIEKLAAKYFMALMEIYEVSPDHIHQMFVTSIHHYLIWASLAALALAFVLSFILTRPEFNGVPVGKILLTLYQLVRR